MKCSHLRVALQAFVGVSMVAMMLTMHHMYRVILDLKLELSRLTQAQPLGVQAQLSEPKDFLGRPSAGIEVPRIHSPPRQLDFLTVGASSTMGCYLLSDAASNSFDVSAASCNDHICPSCFITPIGLSQATTLTISSCSTHMWGRGTKTRTGVWDYVFVNRDQTHSMTVTDAASTYVLPPLSTVIAMCDSDSGSNRLLFPTTNLPSLTVRGGITLFGGDFDASQSSGSFQTSTGAVSLNGVTRVSGGLKLTSGNFDASLSSGSFKTSTGTVSLLGATTASQGLTISSGNFDASSSSGTFATSSGAVSLNGDVKVANAKAFQVGSAGNAGATSIYGSLAVGAGSSPASLNLYGNLAQHDSDSGLLSTFSTGSGAISLNGDTTVATGSSFSLGSSTNIVCAASAGGVSNICHA